MTLTKGCLVLLDLQNEFLSPGGSFPINKESRGFLDKLPDLTAAFRASGQPIFWIRSEYANEFGEVENCHETIIRTGTHSSKVPCCEKGTTGAEFPDNVVSLIATSDPVADSVVITKAWFSAFKKTSLLAELRERKITELYIGGLLTNVCVNATALDARDLGFEVTLVEDCLGWRKRLSHVRALEEMLKHGVQMVSSSDLNTKRSERVMMALYEKNIDFNPIRLLVMSDPKETRLPDFLALNHRGKTPVFVDIISGTSTPETVGEADPETVTINESLAILHYIETYYNPGCPLLPPLSLCAPRAIALARVQESENLRLAYDVLEDAHFDAENNGGKLSDAERAALIEVMNKELDYWEVYAAKTNFIAGDEFGLADCAFFPCLAHMVHRGFEWRRWRHNASGRLEEVDAWPHLKAYFHRVWDRGGQDGCAQKAQPAGWERKGKANVWRGTTGNAKRRPGKNH